MTKKAEKSFVVDISPRGLAWTAIHAEDIVERQSAIFALVQIHPSLRAFFWWVN